MEQEKEMSFLDHLEELRWRLVRSAIAIVIFAVAIWWFKEWIMIHVFDALKEPDFISFKLMCKYLGICVEKVEVGLQSTTMAGQFSYALMMSIMGGFVAAFPFVFYQLWMFVKPGLKQNEVGVVRGLVFWVSLLFFTGIAFGYFVVAPLCVQFFAGFQIAPTVKNDFALSSYMSTIISTVFYTGLLFLLPVISYIFTKLGVMTPDFMRKYRKHAVVGILILSAVITPPDFISQILVAIPIVLLYELSIFVSVVVERKRNRQTIR